MIGCSLSSRNSNVRNTTRTEATRALTTSDTGILSNGPAGLQPGYMKQVKPTLKTDQSVDETFIPGTMVIISPQDRTFAGTIYHYLVVACREPCQLSIAKCALNSELNPTDLPRYRYREVPNLSFRDKEISGREIISCGQVVSRKLNKYILSSKLIFGTSYRYRPDDDLPVRYWAGSM